MLPAPGRPASESSVGSRMGYRKETGRGRATERPSLFSSRFAAASRASSCCRIQRGWQRRHLLSRQTGAGAKPAALQGLLLLSGQETAGKLTLRAERWLGEPGDILRPLQQINETARRFHGKGARSLASPPAHAAGCGSASAGAVASWPGASSTTDLARAAQRALLQADRQRHGEQVQHITLLVSPSLSHFIWLKITQAQTHVPHAAGGVKTSPPGPPPWCSPAPREGTGLGQEFLGEAGSQTRQL